MKSKPSLTAALIFVALWLGITIAGGFLQGGGSATLDGLVKQGPLWGVWLALLFLGVGTLVFRWTGVGFRRADWLDSLRLMWLPLLMIAGFLAAGMQGTVPPPTVIGWVFLNCLFVGISEEWAFRGILLKPFREKQPLLTAVIVTSVIFGLAHALNGFVIGNFGAALGQAVAAAMSGFLFTALRLRTRSLWPVMLLHGLWDFSVFFLAAGSSAEAPAAAAPEGPVRWIAPMILVLPNLLYGCYLLRASRRPALVSDEGTVTKQG